MIAVDEIVPASNTSLKRTCGNIKETKISAEDEKPQNDAEKSAKQQKKDDLKLSEAQRKAAETLVLIEAKSKVKAKATEFAAKLKAATEPELKTLIKTLKTLHPDIMEQVMSNFQPSRFPKVPLPDDPLLKRCLN